MQDYKKSSRWKTSSRHRLTLRWLSMVCAVLFLSTVSLQGYAQGNGIIFIKYKSYLIPVIPGDEDDDGVNDVLDICPNTPVGAQADAEGCIPEQRDTDEDGINDALDQCANTATGEAVNAQGCALTQIDSDDDGVVDANDAYPHQSATQCTP